MENNNNINYDNQALVDLSAPMTLGDWIKTFLLLLIPFVNVILIFVWAFGSNVNKSKKTFFQAQLIMSAVGFLLWLMFAGAILSMFTQELIC